jgi:hypothetical protein
MVKLIRVSDSTYKELGDFGKLVRHNGFINCASFE